MNATDWRAYFEQNRRDRRGTPWHVARDVDPQWREPLGRLLEWLAWHQGGRWAAKDGDEVAQRAAAERAGDAELLRELAVVLNGKAVVNRRTPKPTATGPGLSRQVAFDLVGLACLDIVKRKVRNEAVGVVCDQVRHDWTFQLRWAGEHWQSRQVSWPAVVGWVKFWIIAAASLEFLRGSGRELRHGVQANLANAHQPADQPPRPSRRRLYWPESLRVAPRLTGQAGTLKPRTALLINPFYPKDPHASFGKHVLTPSLALTSIAGVTPPEWDVKYWDENLLQGPPPCDPLPAVVGVTVHLTFAQRAFELADWYRARGSKVVLGGLHVLSCPEECELHADALAIGEGARVWPEILRDADAGTLQAEYRGEFTTPYREEPAPRRDLLPRWGFLTTTSIIATRGCHNRCGFCYLSTDDLHMPYQMRDVEQVAEEIYENGEPYAVFTDNNLGSRRDYLRRLCRALRPLEIIWSAAVTIDVTDEPGLVREMALAGCTGVFIGFESLTNANLDDAHKKTPRAEDYARRVQILHDNGIQVNGSFVLGFDHDRRDCFARTAEWVEANRLECATFHILTPYPGTPLYRQMETEGRLLHKDWSRYDTAHVVFRPRWMSPEELADGYAWCYERLFSHRSIWRRRPTHGVAAYLAMSYLYKRSNLFWHFLIRHRLTHAVWSPLVEVTRRRHVRFRRRLAREREWAVPATGLPAGIA